MALIHEQMAKIMADSTAIGKDQKNQSQGFKFRGIDDVYNSLHETLAKHEVFSVPEVVEDRTEERQTKSGNNLIYRILTMQYTFFAKDGSSIQARVIGEGMDSGDKAANKAMSIAHKYCLLQVFCIPTEETKDPDAESHVVVSKAPIAQPQPKSAPTKPIKKDFDFLTKMGKAKKVVGEKEYYEALKVMGFAHASEIPTDHKEEVLKILRGLIPKAESVQTVTCPNDDTEINILKCDTCTSRIGCPAHGE